MRFLLVDQSNLFHLKNFITNMGASSETFRYFSTRDPETAIENHLLTILLVDEGESVAYGHLDKEGDTIWLGICVKGESRGKGYGKKMMEQLVTTYPTIDIDLSVDASNSRAIGLYESFDFKKIRDKDDIVYMKRERLIDEISSI